MSAGEDFKGFARAGKIKLESDDGVPAILFKGEYFIERASFEAHRESLLALTRMHDLSLRIVD